MTNGLNPSGGGVLTEQRTDVWDGPEGSRRNTSCETLGGTSRGPSVCLDETDHLHVAGVLSHFNRSRSPPAGLDEAADGCRSLPLQGKMSCFLID